MKSLFLRSAAVLCLLSTVACSTDTVKPTITDGRKEAIISTDDFDNFTILKNEDKIFLQHPVTRELVVCDSGMFKVKGLFSDEVLDCTLRYQRWGFVKVSDKPHFTAKDMEKPTQKYPSRRFHADDLTPRW